MHTEKTINDNIIMVTIDYDIEIEKPEKNKGIKAGLSREGRQPLSSLPKKPPHFGINICIKNNKKNESCELVTHCFIPCCKCILPSYRWFEWIYLNDKEQTRNTSSEYTNILDKESILNFDDFINLEGAYFEKNDIYNPLYKE